MLERGDGLHDAELTAFDALRDFDFALASKQGDRAHLAEVHADGVVGLLEGAGGEVEFDVVGVFAGLVIGVAVVGIELGAAAAFGKDIDALGIDGGHQVIELVGRGNVAGQEVVDFTKGEVAFLLAGVDDMVYVFFVLIEFFSHVGAPKGDSRRAESRKNFAGTVSARERIKLTSRRTPWVVTGSLGRGLRSRPRARAEDTLKVLRQLGGARLQRILVYHCFRRFLGRKDSKRTTACTGLCRP